jgi:hypothetical protein
VAPDLAGTRRRTARARHVGSRAGRWGNPQGQRVPPRTRVLLPLHRPRPAADAIHGTNVWCAWNGDHVQVHITLRNSSDDDISATIRPSYRIRGHGRHGSSLFSLKKVEIDGDSHRDWLADAGEPHGVQPGTPISKCEPSLTGATPTPRDVAIHITLGTRRSR